MWPALLTCALLFGLAHSSVYRLIPTFFIGFLLSWLVWKTGSIWTSVLAHALNNGIAATLVYSKPLAAALGAGTQAYLGWKPTLAAVVTLATGMLLLRYQPSGVSDQKKR
jgi:sodium transport system permease protein